MEIFAITKMVVTRRNYFPATAPFNGKRLSRASGSFFLAKGGESGKLLLEIFAIDLDYVFAAASNDNGARFRLDIDTTEEPDRNG